MYCHVLSIQFKQKMSHALTTFPNVSFPRTVQMHPRLLSHYSITIYLVASKKRHTKRPEKSQKNPINPIDPIIQGATVPMSPSDHPATKGRWIISNRNSRLFWWCETNPKNIRDINPNMNHQLLKKIYSIKLPLTIEDPIPTPVIVPLRGLLV